MKLQLQKTITALAILCIVLLSACEDNLSETHTLATTSKLTSSVTAGTALVLTDDDGSNQAIALTWTPSSNRGTNAGIAYSLQFDATETANFSTALSIELGKNVTSKNYTVRDLNSVMVNLLGVGIDESSKLSIRIKAVVLGQDFDPEYSNAISFTATTYDATELLPPYNKLYIVGGATPGGWNINAPDSMTRDLADHFIFRFNAVMTEDDFKIPVAAGNWTTDYYMPPTADGDITSTEVRFVPNGDPDYKWHIPSAGPYKITLDLREMKIHIKPFTPFTQLWIVGDATPAGWDINNPTPMVADNTDPYIFTYEGPLNAGEFKIPTTTGNWGTNFFMPSIDQQPVSGTYATYVVGGSPDRKWRVTEAANYKIVFNQLKETIKITKL
jgi:starch-binding outer membrane protein SusE/F